MTELTRSRSSPKQRAAPARLFGGSLPEVSVPEREPVGGSAERVARRPARKNFDQNGSGEIPVSSAVSSHSRAALVSFRAAGLSRARLGWPRTSASRAGPK
ncbi:hypothetical protein SAMN04487904_108202 [Actinopolyspora lacussalsi subsp. righensis]|uniref:Uncharacterized protein n=1 Tax=Actinopolyspora righensis TaxID=995060 RepID=A0A1I7AXJ8_9ACTN|nr:hypothetical protein SAMN04487904_108202 [Actinopolyspora righensis]